MKTSWISSQSALDYFRGGASRDRRKFLKARIEPSSPCMSRRKYTLRISKSGKYVRATAARWQVSLRDNDVTAARLAFVNKEAMSSTSTEINLLN